MAYAPNGEQLAVGYASGHVHLLEAASLSLLQSVQYSERRDTECMAYAPKGVATCGGLRQQSLLQ